MIGFYNIYLDVDICCANVPHTSAKHNRSPTGMRTYRLGWLFTTAGSTKDYKNVHKPDACGMHNCRHYDGRSFESRTS